MSAPAFAPVPETRTAERWQLLAAGCFAGALAYAVVRYHVFGGVEWQQFPLFILNKALSFTAALLFAGAYLARDKQGAKGFGLTGCTLTLLHVVMSMALLTPANYPKLFSNGRFTFDGGICILAGCVAFLLMAGPAITSAPGVRRALGIVEWKRWQRVGYAMLAACAVHVAALGYKGWTQPETWPGGLPSITMLCFAAFSIPLIRRAAR